MTKEIEQELEVLPSETESLEVSVQEQGKKREILLAYAADHMILGVDYHDIKGKKSLGKPGAEKICSLFGVVIGEPEHAQEFFDSFPDSVKEGGAIVIKTKLYRNGEYIGAGLGARTLKQDSGDLNKAIKMARKSSVIDAVISSFGLSDLFTQDLEDMPIQVSAASKAIERHPEQAQKELTFTVQQVRLRCSLLGRRSRSPSRNPRYDVEVTQ